MDGGRNALWDVISARITTRGSIPLISLVRYLLLSLLDIMRYNAHVGAIY